MQAHHYPFIDLAVHASVRDRFARGDAVAVLSADLSEMVWANGAAAELFGFDSIYDALDEGLAGQAATRRQIESALSGLRRTGKPQSFMMRATSGFSRSMAPAVLEDIALPDGAPALLLASSRTGKILAPGARARQIIAGFEGTGTHVAVLDDAGAILAASSTFGAIGLADSDIARMIADVAGEDDRLVKRMTTAANGPMPTAIGRLADDPALHLLFAVEPAPASGAEDQVMPDDGMDPVQSGEAAAAPLPENGTAADVRPERGIADGQDKPAAAPRRLDIERVRDELNAHLESARHEADGKADAVPQPFAEARGLEADEPVDELSGEADTRTPGQVPGQAADNQEQATQSPDRNQGAAAADAASGSLPAEPVVNGSDFEFDPSAMAARFVWKINRDGEFSEVSPEFASAVGPHSADIIGRRFPDLARVFNLDPDHIIADLLNRRDTWSGKTVFWPIQGTELVAPVDLAALPTYTRDRRFDGFRGFGIVRIGEARKDPEALGLALVPGAPPRRAPGMPGDETPDGRPDSTVPFGPPPLPEGDHLNAEDDDALEMQDLEQDIEDLARMDGAGGVPGDDTDDAPGQDSDGAPEDDDAGDDPFRGERPAIRLVETPMRRDSDKVISLETRRSRPRESLSPGEQAAFREIGARLSETSARDTAADRPAESAPPDQPPAFGKRQPPIDGSSSETRDIDVPFDTAETAERPDPDGSGPDASAAADTLAEQEPAQPAAAPSDHQAPPAPAPSPLPSAFALPARQVMQPGMDSQLVDAIPAALLVHSGDMLIHANAEFLELTGYASLGNLAASGGLDHLLDRPGDDEALDGGGMLVRLAGGGTRRVTARLRSVNWGDGQALLLALAPVEAGAQGAADLAGAEPNDAADAPETTPQDQSNALQIEAQELRSILETATDGVVILDNDGAIRSMNGSACALFNYDEGESQGQPFAMLFAHESQRAVMEYVGGLADHGVSSVLNDGREVIGREAAGGFLPLFMTIGRLSGSNGYCAVLRDITQWKRTEEELRNAKRAAETANSHKSDFLARVSHEIRTPLNAIIGFSEMMAEERFGPIGSPRYLEYAHDIGNSGKHVLDIVNDLLDISKIEAGQVQMEFVAVSLNDHLAESVSLLQPMANSQRVIIRTSLSASVPEVVADQRSIKQIALNLLSNAIRYTPSGGQIVVSTSFEPSGNVVIRIRDTGIGMNRKELEQAMKPFGQVGPGPRQRGDGTGLGLPLTKAMVEANRAQFDIVSAPGEGTLVSISFPPQRVLAD